MEFRKITAIIHADRLEEIEETLLKLGVFSISISKERAWNNLSNYDTGFLFLTK